MEVEWKERLREDERRRRRAYIEKALGGPEPADEYTFEKFDPNLNGSHMILKAALSYDPLKHNLFICGGQGKGKTHLSCAIARRVLDSGGSAQVFRGVELPAALRGRRNYATEYDQIDATSELSKLHVLIVDDIENSVKRVREGYLEALTVLMDKRKNYRRPGFVITSNKTLAELSEILGAKIADRIEEFKHLVIPENIPSARGLLKKAKK